MFFHREDFFTLSYQENKIFLLYLNKKKEVSFFSAPLPSGVVIDDIIVKPQEFAAAVKSALDNLPPRSPRTRRLMVAVPERKIFVKIINIPYVSQDKINEAILAQSETILPIEPKNIYLDWQLIGEVPETNQLKILLVACPRKIIDSIIASLQLTHFHLLAIEARSGGLSRLFSIQRRLPVLIIDPQGPDEYSLIIAKNRTARFSTVVHITKDDNLIRTIRDVVHFYETRKDPKRQVKNLIFIGGEAKRVTGISQTTDMTNSRHVNFGDYVKTNVLADNNFLINLGLYYDLGRGINLLPPELKQSRIIDRENDLMKNLIGIIVLIFLTGLGLAIAAWISLTTTTNNQKKNLSQKIAEPLNSEEVKIEKKIQSTNDLIDKYLDLQKNKTQRHRAVEAIIKDMPAGIIVTNFNLSNQTNTISIAGTRRTKSDLLNYFYKLRESKIFPIVYLPIKGLGSEENTPFEISAKLTEEINPVKSSSNESIK